MPVFRDRSDAGRALAKMLRAYKGRDDVVVLGLPRGGVVVAAEVARALEVPLDVLVVRKLGVPGHEEFAMGALASGGVQLLDAATIRTLGISGPQVAGVIHRETLELSRRERAYRSDREPLPVEDRTCILVDDGLATGASMRAAVMALRALRPARIIAAAPIAAADACASVRAVADECVCALVPAYLYGLGYWYERFEQTTDEEVRELLARSARPVVGAA